MRIPETQLREHPFPMIRSGGLFILLVGLGVIIGSILGESNFLVPLVASACVAFVAQNIFRSRLVRPLGTPTQAQIAALVGAIILEIILTGAVAYAFGFRQSRDFWLWILLVVAVHFLIICIAQGKLPLFLGILCIANAAAGLWLPNVGLEIFWLIDGVLKSIIGGMMLLARPIKQNGKH